MSLSPKELCLQLMHADSASDVKTILSNEKYWDDNSVWRPFADNENNFGSIGNQQSDAISALVEKLINSIDARLMGLAGVSKIQPSNTDYPKDMREAIANFVENKKSPYGERDGRIFYWDEKTIRSESENISLFATGKGSKQALAGQGFPCLTISDKGEGQTPDKFPDTFMSLGKNNKMRIPFVQGKFNMGGTGVFQFCSGENNAQVQLVLSKRNPALLSDSVASRDNEWGFSVIRRVTRKDMRNPMYEYLAPVKNNVLSFSSTDMPIFPSDDKDRPRAYAKSSEFGSLIKLYEYDTKHAITNLTFSGSKGDSLKARIEEALVEAALPIQIAECRPHFKEGRDRRSFVDEILGSITQLGNMDEDRKLKRLETQNPITGTITLGGSPLPVTVYVFAEDTESKPYNPKGVFFTINGQSHGNLKSNFFTRKRVNLSYIKDSMFVVVNCTHMQTDIRVDLFMNSRDRMRSGANSEALETELEHFLGEEPTLQKLNRKRQQDRIKRSLEDQKPLEDTLRNLVKNNPRLAELLPFGLRIPTSNIGLGTGPDENSAFEGKKHPTFFRFRKNRNLIEKSQPINQAVRLVFETDALDNYFSRKLTPGSLSLECFSQNNEELLVDYRVGNLNAGLMSIVLKLDPKKVQVGEILEFNFIVSDDSLVEPFRNKLKLTILDPAITNPPGTDGEDSTGNVPKGSSGGTKSAGLPNISPVAKDEWGEDWNELSAIQIKSNPDAGYDFYYNKDNRDLLYSQSLGKLDPKVLDHQYKIGLMLLALSIIDAHKKPIESGDERLLDESIDVEQLIREVTQAISPFWLSIVEALGSIKFEDSAYEE
jgi:hypothetical protein